MNPKHKPRDDRELKRLMASVAQIKDWIRSRGGLAVGIGVLKGGTGKSTSTLYLALWFARTLGMRVVIVDTDFNSQTLATWVAIRDALGEKVPFALVEHNVNDRKGPTLEKRIKELKADYDVVLVDLGGGDKEAFTDLCIQGDLLLMPSAPSGWETVRIQATLQTAARAARLNENGLGVHYFFVACKFTTSLPEEQRAILATDLSERDPDFIPVPFVHPYFDVSGHAHYTRAWEETPRLNDLDEFSHLVRHVLREAINEEEQAA